MKNNGLLFLICSIFSVPVWSKLPNIEGIYTLASGSHLLVLPKPDFVIVSYANVLTGKYKQFKNGEVEFKLNHLDLPEVYITEFHTALGASEPNLSRTQSDQIFIQFDPDLASNTYLGINSDQTKPYLQQIYHKNQCLEYSKMNITVPRQTQNYILLYRQDPNQNVFINRIYKIPQEINRIDIRNNPEKKLTNTFKAKIEDEGLSFLESFYAGTEQRMTKRTALTNIPIEDLQYYKNFVNSYKNIQRNANKIFFESKPIHLKQMKLDQNPLIGQPCEADEY